MTVAGDGDGRLAAARDLVAATRELTYAAATTDVSAEEMREAEQTLGELTRMLEKQSRTRVTRAPFDGLARAREAGAETPYPVFAYNPLGIPLDIHLGADWAYARLRTNALHEGPLDSMHGGFSAELMDVMLGVLQQAQRKRALTVSLELRYLDRIPLDVDVELHSRVVETSGRKIRAEGWIEHEGRRMVEARGLFIDLERNPA